MTPRFPIPDGTPHRNEPDGAAIRTRDEEPNENTVRADVEEEIMALLWAADPGNQGA